MHEDVARLLSIDLAGVHIPPCLRTSLLFVVSVLDMTGKSKTLTIVRGEKPHVQVLMGHVLLQEKIWIGKEPALLAFLAVVNKVVNPPDKSCLGNIFTY